jgi:acid phosphatase class B
VLNATRPSRFLSLSGRDTLGILLSAEFDDSLMIRSPGFYRHSRQISIKRDSSDHDDDEPVMAG